jgi:hypothetical protein
MSAERPAPSQPEAARSLLIETLRREPPLVAEQVVLGPREVSALRTLLAATAQPEGSDRAPDTLPWALRICRTKLLPWLEAQSCQGDQPSALRLVLDSCTFAAPPSEEELVKEAMRKFPDAPPGFDAEQHDVEVSRDAYIAGARREGRR